MIPVFQMRLLRSLKHSLMHRTSEGQIWNQNGGMPLSLPGFASPGHQLSLAGLVFPALLKPSLPHPPPPATGHPLLVLGVPLHTGLGPSHPAPAP